MTGQHLTEDEIQRMIASDPDAPEATEDQLAQARPFAEVFPALAEAMRKNAQGRPARLDQDGQGRKVGRGGRLARNGSVIFYTAARRHDGASHGVLCRSSGLEPLILV